MQWQGAVPVGNGVGQVASRCAVVRTGVAGQGAAPVDSGFGEVACKRCAVADFAVAGQGPVPVCNRVGQVASRCAVAKTVVAWHGAATIINL